jgi:DNA-directed RNA polymerase subunit RPC12/RpoP
MTTQPELFDLLPRSPRRKLAHVIDAGPGEVHNVVLLRCAQCGWESGWTAEYTLTESKRGIPCPRCNP